MPFAAFLDADVLCPAALRDVLLSLAEAAAGRAMRRATKPVVA